MPIKKKTKKKRTVLPIINPADMPATAGMIDLLDKKISSQLQSMDKKWESRFLSIDSNMHAIRLVIEKQEARNQVVLDGYTQV